MFITKYIKWEENTVRATLQGQNPEGLMVKILEWNWKSNGNFLTNLCHTLSLFGLENPFDRELCVCVYVRFFNSKNYCKEQK